MAELDNRSIGDTLAEFAALLELAGADPFRPRAYRRAAELIRGLPLPVERLVRECRVRELRGVGPGVEALLRELVEVGSIRRLEELRATTSPELIALGRLLGISAGLSSRIAVTLGIRTVDELRAAAREGRLREVRGIGPRTEAKIVESLAREPRAVGRPVLLPRARSVSRQIAEALGGAAAGEARRWRELSDRLRVVVPTERPAEVRARFAALADIVAIVDDDLGVTLDGTPVELVLTPPAAFGTALLQATGSARYVESLGPLPEASDEEDLFRRLGLPYLVPELRELPAPLGEPPDLVDSSEIRGDLHCHTTWSDGKQSVLEMAEAAQTHGYEYLAICDHTSSLRVVRGLAADDVRRQGEEIAQANELLRPFRILRGTECDILPDGSLDLPDDVLAELDWVQVSLHAGQRAPRAELTARVVYGMQHPAVRSLSHPLGRLLGHRPENELDLERTIEVAVEHGVALEVNGLPNRLDLSGEHVRLAIAGGASITCSTDAHSVVGLRNMELAVHTARRGWACTADVLNTLPLSELLVRE